MATGDSTVIVRLVGDTKSLDAALGRANTSLGGLGKGLLLGGTALVAGKELTDFIQTATKEADRLGDATTRVNAQLGPELAQNLVNASRGFTDIGASSQDILELEAAFADMTTALGVADPAIAKASQEASVLATKLSLVKDADPSEIIKQIGMAAGGSEKAAKALGVTLIAGADATTQMNNVLAQLQVQYGAVGTGAKDLEQQQKKLDAELETFSALAGGPISDALAGIVGFINDEIEAIPGAIQGWQMLGRAIEQFGRDALGPIARVNDALGALGNLLGDISFNLTHIGANVPSERRIIDAANDHARRNGLDNVQGRP